MLLCFQFLKIIFISVVLLCIDVTVVRVSLSVSDMCSCELNKIDCALARLP